MRTAHGREPGRALSEPAGQCYFVRMRLNRLSRTLRWGALGLALAGLGLWLAAGARMGWTQTSIVEMQHDEITGIEYPVRRPAFIAGIEIPLGTGAAAGVLLGASLIVSRRRSHSPNT